MRRKLFSLGKTEVYFHLATLLFAAYMVWLGHGVMLCVSMGSIVLHEASHAMVAALFSKPPQEIEITPLGALMRLEDEAALPLGKRLLMLAAGPAASFGLCWCAIWLTSREWIPLEVGRLLFGCNVLQLFLNLLPALPLDGGRILALVLGIWLRQETVRKIILVMGTAIGLCCIGGNFLLSLQHGGWNLSLAMAGCFIMYASAVGTTSHALAELRMFMDRKIRMEKRGALSCHWLAVADTLPFRAAVKKLSPGRYTMLTILELGSMRPLHTCGEDALISAYLNEPGGCCRLLLQEDVCERR